MYGDPRGYKYDGPAQWYQWGPSLHLDRLTEIYLWSMNRTDLDRIPLTGWIGYLEGKNPNHPVDDLKRDLESVRRRARMIRTDVTTADTRLADFLLDFNPAATNALLNLTIGGYFSNGKIWTLHSRFRHFDPDRRRAGLPPDVGALVDKLTADSASITVVNVNPVEARTLILQAGGYGEHQFESATIGGTTTPINGPLLTVRLEPGSGAKIEFKMARYKNPPTFAQPWDRGWYAR
jgi:hypothetical protein